MMLALQNLIVKEEETERDEGNCQRVILVEFSNGHLDFTKKKLLKYTCYENVTENSKNRTKRILVAKSNRLCYTGTNFDSASWKITSTVLKVCKINKKDSSVEFYDADLFHMKPLRKCLEINSSMETKSYGEMSSALVLAFGSKSKVRKIQSNQRNDQTTASINTLLSVPESKIELDVSTQNNTVAAIPPQNSSAVNVDEIYKLSDIIPEKVYSALDSETTVFLSATNEDIRRWKDEKKFSDFIILFIQNNMSSMDQNKAKLLSYLHFMFCLLRTTYREMKRKDPIPSVPSPFKQSLMDSFTIKKLMPERMKDKLLAHALVLGLILNKYVINGTVFASSAKISVKRMVSVAHALGCHVSESKETNIVELKLPLYKFPIGPRQRKKRM